MGQRVIDDREHRRGLVLGLTLAEVLLLLLFLLLLGLGARLQQLERDRDDALAALKPLARLDTGAHSESSVESLARRLSHLDTLEAKIVVLEEEKSELVAERSIIKFLPADPAKLAALGEVVEKAAKINPDDPPAVLERAIDVLIQLGADIQPDQVKMLSEMRADAERKAAQTGSHDWPPIISLSEADGYFFQSGSAHLSQEFQATLSGSVIERLLGIIKQYDVNIIEVIGHTDEQQFSQRPSNLDTTLVPFLKGQASAGGFIPADNAGLGLARAVAVVRVLTNDERLTRYTVLPFSGAQLIDVGDKLSDGGIAGDVKERRRIEIRVRRSSRDQRAHAPVWHAETQAGPSDKTIVGEAAVIDGDTIEMGETRVRIWGVDAIEAGQLCTVGGRTWNCARDVAFGLTAHLEEQTVVCQPRDRDPYGRIVATCTARGADVGAWLVERGLALDYPKFSGEAYAAEEAKAKAAKRGIWRGEFVLPWEWRQRQQARPAFSRERAQ